MSGNPHLLAAFPHAVDTLIAWGTVIGDWLQRYSGIIALFFTGAVVYFTRELARLTADLHIATRDAAEAARRTAEHFPIVERAYVKLSHKPPGLIFDAARHQVSVVIQVVNMGHTPATVTDVKLTPVTRLKGYGLPSSPSYSAPKDLPSVEGSLGADEPFFIHATFDLPEWHDVQAERMMLYLVGYVDYIDAFEVRHRGGYARLYEKRLDVGEPRNNLTIVADLAYNYDRLRTPGEGKDWREGS